jgi:ribosomal protein L37AE/L43A
MEYEGKLYGKVGGEYFPMIETTKEINRYKQRIKELEEQVSNTDLLHDVSHCPLCNSDNLHQYKLHHIHCKDCKNDFDKGCD